MWAGAQTDGDRDKASLRGDHGSCADNVLIQEPGHQEQNAQGAMNLAVPRGHLKVISG